MDLLPEEVRRLIPPLRSTENDPDPLLVVKFFTPDSSWTWYVAEGSVCTPGPRGCEHAALAQWTQEQDVMFFGLVVGHVQELGYFSLRELTDVRGPFGLKVERDAWWVATPLSTVRSHLA